MAISPVSHNADFLPQKNQKNNIFFFLLCVLCAFVV